MQIRKLLILSFLSLFLLGGCKSDKATSKKVKASNKTETPSTMLSSEKLFSRAKNELKWTDDQAAKVTAILKTNKDLRAKVPVVDGKKNLTELKKINIKQENEIKNVLGEKGHTDLKSFVNKRSKVIKVMKGKKAKKGKKKKAKKGVKGKKGKKAKKGKKKKAKKK